MENDQLQNPEEQTNNSQNVIINNPSDQRPDEEGQNETGYAGTTNSISENRQDSDEYQPAIEDTMIGYEGDDKDLDLDIRDDNVSTENTRGIDDND